MLCLLNIPLIRHTRLGRMNNLGYFFSPVTNTSCSLCLRCVRHLSAFNYVLSSVFKNQLCYLSKARQVETRACHISKALPYVYLYAPQYCSGRVCLFTVCLTNGMTNSLVSKPRPWLTYVEVKSNHSMCNHDPTLFCKVHIMRW